MNKKIFLLSIMIIGSNAVQCMENTSPEKSTTATLPPNTQPAPTPSSSTHTPVSSKKNTIKLTKKNTASFAETQTKVVPKAAAQSTPTPSTSIASTVIHAPTNTQPEDKQPATPTPQPQQNSTNANNNNSMLQQPPTPSTSTSTTVQTSQLDKPTNELSQIKKNFSDSGINDPDIDNDLNYILLDRTPEGLQPFNQVFETTKKGLFSATATPLEEQQAQRAAIDIGTTLVETGVNAIGNVKTIAQVCALAIGQGISNTASTFDASLRSKGIYSSNAAMNTVKSKIFDRHFLPKELEKLNQKAQNKKNVFAQLLGAQAAPLSSHTDTHSFNNQPNNPPSPHQQPVIIINTDLTQLESDITNLQEKLKLVTDENDNVNQTIKDSVELLQKQLEKFHEHNATQLKKNHEALAQALVSMHGDITDGFTTCEALSLQQNTLTQKVQDILTLITTISTQNSVNNSQLDTQIKQLGNALKKLQDGDEATHGDEATREKGLKAQISELKQSIERSQQHTLILLGSVALTWFISKLYSGYKAAQQAADNDDQEQDDQDDIEYHERQKSQDKKITPLQPEPRS